MNDATCLTCRFWRRNKPKDPQDFKKYFGKCIHSPPVPVYNGGYIENQFPETDPRDYCGQHQPEGAQR
ncbi:MAG: hypothetical protein F4Y26_05225 [Gammaproteobacteria bacterium]|nr:hypothetical protein [Gammaproteobacteria bacterium]